MALLGLGEKPVPRTELSRTLWPGVDHDKALAALRTTVWRLNRACPGVVAQDADFELRLIADVDVKNLVAASRLVLDPGRRMASADLLDGSVLGMFRSCVDLLPGWYDDWVMFHRERLVTIRVEALRAAATRLMEDRYLPEALDLALAAISAEPLDERTHMLVAAVHLAQGNVSEAVRQYHLCARVFARELGVRPSERFRRMIPNGHRRDHNQTMNRAINQAINQVTEQATDRAARTDAAREPTSPISPMLPKEPAGYAMAR
ncbi:bacterial transcriptional activator domain-containing protein [Microlunatus sp. Gsoil 973]|uniref:AfsR/SARP family transcriptional regulator n=1 Tax=Microlunatus sp. Gsoil 973 TaxID=2672569 RepID=UPI0018A8239B|nr:bacterial transcriptional activator domain-containing protein [Microlunatus sp. Gsoil 973]